MYPTAMLLLLFLSSAIQSPATAHEPLPPGPAQSGVSVAGFDSFELRNGGVAIIRHGPIRRVTLLKGMHDYTLVKAADGALVVDKCPGRCPPGYELEVEIVTPDIGRISVAHGGTIQVAGHFLPRAEIDVAVSQGGTIDIRPMTVNHITASVYQGGQIFAVPRTAMRATVVSGGRIIYWGDAAVKSSVEDGGVVARGTAADAHKPLWQLTR